MKNPAALCPCHSKLNYSECCEPYHKGKKAETPLKLMRSRYSAYALKLPAYIIMTTHTESPLYIEDKNRWRKEILKFSDDHIFRDLQILEAKDNTVTFRAVLFTFQGMDRSFTEKSLFEQKDGDWFYKNHQ